jgi:transcriptional regulator with XRE-family HTH domain
VYVRAGLSFGERVAYYRRIRGLYQHGLALRMNRSVSWVRKVESGERRVESITVVEELAQALRVDPAVLLGGRLQQPKPPHGSTAKTEAVRAVSRLLRSYDSFPHESDSDSSTSVDDLRCQVASLRHRYNTARNNLSSVIVDLPIAITAVRRAVRRAQHPRDRENAYSLLADVLRLTAMEVRQYGDPELAWLAADRAVLAAERSGDSLLVAATVGTLVHQMMSRGHNHDAVTVAINAAATVTPRRDAEAQQWSVWGALHLFASQAAVRAGDIAYRSLIDAAKRAAEAVAVDRNDYWTFFGPTNVKIQLAGISVEAGDPEAALRVGLRTNADQLVSVNRRTNHRIHLARAHLMLGHDDEAVAAISEAERVGPELVRTDPASHETISAVVGRRKRPPSRELTKLAVRLGVVDG